MTQDRLTAKVQCGVQICAKFAFLKRTPSSTRRVPAGAPDTSLTKDDSPAEV